MDQLILAVFIWVCALMGVDDTKMAPPKVEVVSGMEMAINTCPNILQGPCKVYPAASQVIEGKMVIFVLDSVDKNNKIQVSFIVHQFVHYVQVMKKYNGDPTKIKPEDRDKWEEEALKIQKLYIHSLSV